MAVIRVALAIAALSLAPHAAHAAEPTAAELVAANAKARGGADRLSALQAVNFKGRLLFPGGFELAYAETRARGGGGADRTRVDATLQGLSLVQAYDGREAWRINPFQGRRDAERMSADEARQIADQARLDGALLAARSAGASVTYLGREDFDGTDAHKLRVVEKDGDEYVYLLDPDSMLEIKVTETRRIRGSPQVSETELGDYEPVGGVLFPMSIESWQAGQPNQRQRVLITEATANPPVTPALFAMPTAPAPAVTGMSSTSGRTDAAQSAVQKPNMSEPPAGSTPPATPPAAR